MTLIPASQRRTMDELSDRLDMGGGDASAKRSAFWLMLVLSGVIAVSGVVSDSTATVIGAMIIAELSTPILGVGFGIVSGRAKVVGQSLLYVVISVAIVVAVGFVVAQVLPNPTNVLANSQVAGRTSPTLMDLMAAIATGFAGAVAITRRDVGDVLPGVAIAISLVPPLGVVGVCLGSGAPSLALGAAVLFGSNVLALIIACTAVLMFAGYAREAADTTGMPRRGRAYIVLSTLLVLVVIPMTLNSLSSIWAAQVREAAESWLADTDSAQVQNVTVRTDVVTVEVLSPGDLPDLAKLEVSVDRIVPWKPLVVVEHTVGQRIQRSGG